MPKPRSRKYFMIPIVLFMKTSEGFKNMNRSGHEFLLLTIIFSITWELPGMILYPLLHFYSQYRSPPYFFDIVSFLNTTKFPESLGQLYYFHKYLLVLQKILKLKLEILIFQIPLLSEIFHWSIFSAYSSLPSLPSALDLSPLLPSTLHSHFFKSSILTTCSFPYLLHQTICVSLLGLGSSFAFLKTP